MDLLTAPPGKLPARGSVTVMEYDCIIIGGGISGMTAAALLARTGRAVALFERAPRLAPTIAGFVRGGMLFETGLHCVSDGELMAELLDAAGVWQRLEVRRCSDDAFDTYLELGSNWEFGFPQGIARLRRRLIEEFPKERDGVVAYLAVVEACWAQLRQMLSGRLDLPDALHAAARQTLAAFLDESIGDPRLRRLLTCHRILYGMASTETSLLYHAMIVGSYYQGCGQFYGGGSAVVEAFAKALDAHGVEVHCGREIRVVECDCSGSFAAVHTADGARFAARSCLASIHPRALRTMLDRPVPPAYQRRLAKMEETDSAFVLYGHCSADLGAGNLIVNQVEADATRDGAPDASGLLYISQSISPGFRGGISAIVPATLDQCGPAAWCPPNERPPGYREWKSSVVERIERGALSSLGSRLPEFHVMDAATPLTFRDRMFTPSGGLYGLKHRISDLPVGPKAGVPGVYLCGQSVTAPGLLGAAISAHLAVSKVNGDV